MFRRSLLTVFAAVVLAANASAGTVTFFMMKDSAGPGTWRLFARTGAGDNGGIAAFNIPLADIATLTNESPYYTLNLSNFQPAGFSELRVPAPDNNAVEKTVFAAQQLIPYPTANIVYGFGQTAGSWAATEYLPAAGWKQPNWDANLLLASGTYAPGANPRVDFDDPALSVLLFDNTRQTRVDKANFAFVDSVAPTIDDFNLDDSGGVFRHTFHPAFGEPPFTWSVTPLSGSPALPATISQTGEFEWHASGSQRPGSYSWAITAMNSAGSDTAVLSVSLIPEPATTSLVGIAMLGLAGVAGRRN